MSSGHNLNVSVLPPVTTAYQYTAFGNATQVVASTPDGFSKTIANDVTYWLLGQLTRASVDQRGAVTGAIESELREDSWFHPGSKCLIVIWRESL